MNPPETSIHGAQELTDNWIRENGVRYFNELTNLAILMEETGELARIFARRYGEQSVKEQEDISNDKIGEEMADVLFVLFCLANQTGINLEEEFLKTLEKKTKRDLHRHKNNHKLI